MHKKIIAAGFFICFGLLVFCDEAPAGRTDNGALQWHSIRDYARLQDSVDRKIYIHFWAEWCGFCRRMERETFSNQKVANFLQENFFLIKVNTDREQRVANAFKVRGVPANLFLSEEGDQIVRRDGYIPPNVFMRVLEAIVDAY